MSVIVAINHVDRLVLLEDGRELPITGYYASPGKYTTLKAGDQLLAEYRVDDPKDAEVFTVNIPGADAAIICEMGAVSVIDNPSDAN